MLNTPLYIVPSLDKQNGRAVKSIRFEQIKDAGDSVRYGEFLSLVSISPSMPWGQYRTQPVCDQKALHRCVQDVALLR